MVTYGRLAPLHSSLSQHILIVSRSGSGSRSPLQLAVAMFRYCCCRSRECSYLRFLVANDANPKLRGNHDQSRMQSVRGFPYLFFNVSTAFRFTRL